MCRTEEVVVPEVTHINPAEDLKKNRETAEKGRPHQALKTNSKTSLPKAPHRPEEKSRLYHTKLLEERVAMLLPELNEAPLFVAALIPRRLVIG